MRRDYLLSIISRPDGSFVRQVLASGRVSLRGFAVSSAQLVVPDSHPVVAELLAGSARCEVWMVSVDEQTLVKHRLLGGRVTRLTGDDSPFGSVTVHVSDDRAMLDTLLGWQVPDAPIAGQSAAEYAVYTGPTETRVKAAIQATVTRLGLPWDVVPTRGKGTAGTLELRMHDLARKINPALEADRLILSVERQETGRWTVDIRGGETFPRPLTPLSGVLSSWSWVSEPQSATRAVVGGRKQGVEREFKETIDTAGEVELGVPLEIFVDSRNTDEGSDIAESGWEALGERSAKAGLTAQLRETSWFRFPDAYTLGDRVTVQVGALEVDDVITNIDITHDTKDGFRVTPTVGLATADPQKRLVDAVAKISTAVRGLERQ